MGVVSSLTELQQLSGTQWTKSWSLPLRAHHLHDRQRLNEAEKIMRQHELGSWPQHCILFSRCLWRERGTSGTTPVAVLALKAYFGMHCCWLAPSLCFSAERPRQLKSGSAARNSHHHHVNSRRTRDTSMPCPASVLLLTHRSQEKPGGSRSCDLHLRKSQVGSVPCFHRSIVSLLQGVAFVMSLLERELIPAQKPLAKKCIFCFV